MLQQGSIGCQALRDTLSRMSSIVPVVLSGGVGTRLWPLSRQEEPKQFQSLIGDTSMLSQTLSRVEGLGQKPLIVANLAHVPDLAAHAENVRVLAEPVGRNTAPAVAAAALCSDPDDILIVMPADHYLSGTDEFGVALTQAIRAAEAGYLTTFGIVPDRAETGYGYIVPVGTGEPQRVSQFVEKPDLATASRLLEEGALWNSGMFVFPVGILLEELERLEPDLLAVVETAIDNSIVHSWGRELGPGFSEAPDMSIDVAVMERTTKAAVVSLKSGWSDIGSWASLWELGDKDGGGNVLRGPVTVLDSSGSYLRSEGPRLAVSGAEDLIVVATPTAVLVTTRDRAQSVKELFALLEAEDR